MILLNDKYIFVVAQKAIVQLDNTFLLMKRSSKAKVFPNHWDFPGGKLEHGEDYKDGLVREVKEETNLNVIIEDVEFIYIENERRPAYVVLFKCEKEAGEVKLSFEHSEFKWVTKEQALKLNLEPYLKAYFESID